MSKAHHATWKLLSDGESGRGVLLIFAQPLQATGGLALDHLLQAEAFEAIPAAFTLTGGSRPSRYR